MIVNSFIIFIYYYYAVLVRTESAGLESNTKINATGTDTTQRLQFPCEKSRNKNDPEHEDGDYFGSAPNSRLIYRLPETEFKTFNLTLDLKTQQTNGIIFYAADETGKDFIGLYSSEKKLSLSYNCDDNKFDTNVISLNVADGYWHTIKLFFHNNSTTLSIDESYKGTLRGCKKILLKDELYLGSVNPKLFARASANLEGQNISLVGCLKNVKLNKEDISKNAEHIGTVPCRKNIEAGTFFHGNKSYITAIENFDVGLELKIEMLIKPTQNTGVLAAVHSTLEYITLQLLDGNLRFSADNGNGKLYVEYQPSRSYFCDGQWHSITALKMKNIIILTVDGHSTMPVFDNGELITNPQGPLFIGGVPDRNSGEMASYKGCISALLINEKNIDFTKYAHSGQISINQCPT